MDSRKSWKSHWPAWRQSQDATNADKGEDVDVIKQQAGKWQDTMSTAHEAIAQRRSSDGSDGSCSPASPKLQRLHAGGKHKPHRASTQPHKTSSLKRDNSCSPDLGGLDQQKRSKTANHAAEFPRPPSRARRASPPASTDPGHETFPLPLDAQRQSFMSPFKPTSLSKIFNKSSEDKSGVPPDHRPPSPGAEPELIRQPETKPISQEQLVAEVKGIYAGLVMVESKCIEVDNAQNAQGDSGTKLNNEQWQALIALHRTLLHEHHDFFLASQHPSASPALRRLASKYAMPARMWRHGIHSFLELLRHRLPASLEHMLTFIYLAYSMMALLYETVPAFEDTWIECLGDLGRYRMAIEDDDLRDREVWTAVSKLWYSKASEKAPTTGRLYHHLAILARPNVVMQLFYYTKSLCVPIPFLSARESIMTLFDPALSQSQRGGLSLVDSAFVRIHAILFTKSHNEKLAPAMEEFLGSLDVHISRLTRRFMETGYHMGMTNCCALLDYGNDENPIMTAIKPRKDDAMDIDTTGELAPPTGPFFENCVALMVRTHEVILRRFGDPNIFPYLHISMVFIHHLTRYPVAMALLEKRLPWNLLALMLNTLMVSYKSFARIEDEAFPGPSQPDETPRPLPEDFAQRGVLWAEQYYPSDFFAASKVDDAEKYFEVASMTEERKERILWLGCRLAAPGRWLTYSAMTHHFGVSKEFDVEIEPLPWQGAGAGSEAMSVEGDASAAGSPAPSSHTALAASVHSEEQDFQEVSGLATALK